MVMVLWYCPPANSVIHEMLSSLIMSLQSLFPDSVPFEPHVTLTSQLNCKTKSDASAILNAAQAAISSIRDDLESGKFKEEMICFDSVKIGKNYFEKVKICCKSNKYLYGIAQIICELFVLKTPDPAASKEWVLNSFEPHVSLVYSNIYHVDQALQRSVLQRIEDTLGTVLVGDSVKDPSAQVSWCLEKKLRGWNLNGTFKVVRCEDPVNEWEIMGSVDV